MLVLNLGLMLAWTLMLGVETDVDEVGLLQAATATDHCRCI